MDGETLRSAVERARSTELDRLGSPRLLVALSDGDPTRARLLDAAAASERAARETFRAWAEDEADEAAREAFAAVAAQEDEHLRRVRAELDGEWTPDEGAGPMHSYLRGRDSTVERVAGGMVGRPLVSLRTYDRLVEFFAGGPTETTGASEVPETSETTADVLTDLRAETQETLTRGLSLIGSACETDEDWAAAEMVAGYTVRLAYDDYADALRGTGIDPRGGADG